MDFFKNMIDHHSVAVVMGQDCVDKAVHEELAAMCEEIIAIQGAEIEQRQTWSEQCDDRRGGRLSFTV